MAVPNSVYAIPTCNYGRPA